MEIQTLTAATRACLRVRLQCIQVRGTPKDHSMLYHTVTFNATTFRETSG